MAATRNEGYLFSFRAWGVVSQESATIAPLLQRMHQDSKVNWRGLSHVKDGRKNDSMTHELVGQLRTQCLTIEGQLTMKLSSAQCTPSADSLKTNC